MYIEWCRAQDEMERLKRNMDRRKARERAKGKAESPSEANSPAADGNDAGEGPTSAPTVKKGRSKKNTEGTARKCANCGQVGHIKTNKKSAKSTFICDPVCRDPTQKDTTNAGDEGGASSEQRMLKEVKPGRPLKQYADPKVAAQKQRARLTRQRKRQAARTGSSSAASSSSWLFQPSQL